MKSGEKTAETEEMHFLVCVVWKGEGMIKKENKKHDNHIRVRSSTCNDSNH